METVQVRFPRRELAKLDQRVKAGEYPSRSEAIRDLVRRAELFSVMADFMALTKTQGLTRKDIARGSQRIRESAHRSLFPK